HFAEQLVLLQRRVAWINDEVILVINDAFQISRRHVEHQTDARWHAFEKPDVRHRHGQFDVTHALPADARECDLDTAPVTDHAAVLDAFVFATGTFPVLHGAENTLTKQPSLFRLERTVIDRLRILDLPLRPGADRFGGSDADADVIHQIDRFQSQQLARGFFGANHILVGVATVTRSVFQPRAA